MIALKNNKEEVFLNISRWDDKKIIYADWRGQVSENDVKEGALEILNELRVTEYKNLLNNNKNLKGTWVSANKWIAEEWIPKAMEIGFEKFAHVLSVYLFGKLSAEEMQMNVGNNFKMKLFDNLDEAEKWLLNNNS